MMLPSVHMCLGPFTLAGQIMELNDLLKLSFKKADKVAKLLDIMCRRAHPCSKGI